MKPPPFRYLRPESLEEACELLAECGDEGKILAGGQSLVPAMNLRLARPAALIDINRLSGLEYMRRDGPVFRIGALTRHESLFRAGPDPDPFLQLIHEVAGHIGHWAIRERGTFGGSLAHSDPAAEWGLVLCTLGGRVLVRGRADVRSIEATDFFEAPFLTGVRPHELLMEAELRPPTGRASFGFAEFSRRPGDFALVMVLVAIRVDDDTIAEARIGVGGVQGRPTRVGLAEDVAIGRQITPGLIDEVMSVAPIGLEAMDDQHASSDFRLALTSALAGDAMRRALHPWLHGGAEEGL